MNRDVFVDRRKKIIETMEDNSMLLMFSGKPPKKSADEEYYYHPNRNFYYISGIDRQEFVLMISKTKDSINEQIFIPDLEAGQHSGDYSLTVEQVQERSGIKTVLYTDKFEEIISRALHRMPIKRLYLDLERFNINEPINESEYFARDMKEKYPYIVIDSVYHTIANMRRIKTSEEIEEIKRAIEITRDGIEAIMSVCRPGMNERRLEAEFTYNLLKNGERDVAFKSIIAAGKNAEVSHYSANNTTIGDDVLVLLDVGAQSNLYCSDISRAFPANGKFSEFQRQLYEQVLAVNKELINFLKPGITAAETNSFGTKLLDEKMASIGVTREKYKKMFTYGGANHYVGLDTHDVGFYDIPIEPGMVFAVDVIIGIPEESIAFRIEDDCLVTEDGCINLSDCIIKEIDDVESFIEKAQK